MARLLPRSFYAELAAIVGEANLSEDDHVVASHDWFGLGADPTSRTLLGKPPGAVVMPGSTEEVAAVIKACNRHGVKFKAHSTGYGNYAGVGTLGSVSIDLRRMNRMEIDPTNRMAVIEPYVTAGQLMSEALKHHLMCHIIGAGPIHSPLASATSFAGMGVPANHTSNNSRNLLSAEWVTPEGEIVRIGSAGSGDVSSAGWYAGDGPGPGFRGMLRGVFGATGGLGVFTRIGYKLYPWAGPAKLEWTGAHPQRGLRLPEHFACHQVAWERWEHAAEGTHHLFQSKCVTLIARTPPSGIASMLSPTNRDHYQAYSSARLPEVATDDAGKGWSLMLMAWSADELAWKEAVLAAILLRTQGRKVVMAPEHAGVMAASLVTSLYVARFCRMGTAAGVSLGILDSAALLPKAIQYASEAIGDETRPGGSMLESAPDHNWMWTNEGRHFWTENNPVGNRFSRRSLGSVVEFVLYTIFKAERAPLGITFFQMGMGDLFGPKLGHAQRWMRRVKTTWDPKNLSDSKTFIGPQPDAAAKVWP
ncbi:MAG TPA: FAD-binding oxidoreductase, partial [Burkholderiaceae bacterium]|nr:FAD-binding oxidoreductase [Burkholderiaceae bacterium]